MAATTLGSARPAAGAAGLVRRMEAEQRTGALELWDQMIADGLTPTTTLCHKMFPVRVTALGGGLARVAWLVWLGTCGLARLAGLVWLGTTTAWLAR